MEKEFDILKQDKRFRYQLLDRLRTDCNYYLGYGNRCANCLWSKSEVSIIENMKNLWNSFDEKDKPEWLTWEQILEYERKMVPES